jgi:hypothetical protein
LTENIFRLDCDEDHLDVGSHEDFIVKAGTEPEIAELEELQSEHP